MTPEKKERFRAGSVRVFGRAEWLQFAGLSLVRLAAVILFAGSWSSPAAWRQAPGAMVISTILLAMVLAVDWIRWSALAFMSRPLPVAAKPGLRVAVATTCVAELEPPEFTEPVLRALVALDYPHDTYLLDEDDDSRMRNLCAGLGVVHFTRKHQPEYQTLRGPFASRTKHGNYNSWLEEIGYGKYDVLIAFDPDHIPVARFASATLGYFADPRVGFVQTPQVYRNQGVSWIARGSAEETYHYYSVVQMAAFGSSRPVVTGCHCAHRMSALRDCGGYPAHPGEDLLATVRYQAKGWSGIFVPQVLARGLAPESWADYLNQQFRWAWSVLDVKLNHLGGAAGGGYMSRVLALLQGVGYIQDAALATAGLPLFCFMLATGRSQEPLLELTSVPGFALFATLWMTDRYKRRFFLEPASEGGLHWRSALLRAAKWPRVLRAFAVVLLGREIDYLVTPKMKHSRRRSVDGRPIAAVVLCVAAAWIAGIWGDRLLNPILHIWAAALVAAGVALIASQRLERAP